MTLHAGQLVECINAGPGFASGKPIELVQNAIYRIRDIGGMSGNLVNVGTIHYYAPERFRPIVERKTDIAIFTAMLNPSLEDVANLILQEVTLCP
jgi:hypothetical protein